MIKLIKQNVNPASRPLFVGLALSLGLLSVAPIANANIKVSDTSTATFNFGGTVAASCKVNSSASLNANNLNLLDNNASQDIGTLEVWCNTGGNATTRYSSANQGFLVSGESKIPYSLALGDSNNTISLQQEHVNTTTAAGTGIDGQSESQSLKVVTQGSGLDNAGDYSDTITVTVAYN